MDELIDKIWQLHGWQILALEIVAFSIIIALCFLLMWAWDDYIETKRQELEINKELNKDDDEREWFW